MREPRQRPGPDQASADSFPASDPPAHSGITGVGGPDERDGTKQAEKQKPSEERSQDERPTGHPTSDRHAHETAHVGETEKTTTRRP